MSGSNRIARVFPRITKATPQDDYTFFAEPGFRDFLPPIDEVHVSVAFSGDLREAEWLAEQWQDVAPVKLGGPATGEPGGAFVPGMYLKPGYVITSRGCPNRCWHCEVWKREGQTVRELPITEGNNVLDDNLLACSDEHIRAVFEMLKRQKYGQPEFTGGLEAAILKPWHVEELRKLSPHVMYFAYDTPDDYEPLVEAGRMLLNGGFTEASHALKCYVLIGYPKDTFEAAEKRLIDTVKAGFMPMAMLFENKNGYKNPAWKLFAREWANAYIVGSKLRGIRQEAM